ncbi:HTD2 family dehydratase [Sphingosinicella rhizophila]|uniref:MaoC family dehydratase N-terminal domain-containing protein n=1 Tax=Sphingosinicella rhizophila TaxID=3050082 RepID=A0ABU3Q5U4_9SPHN|nr:MaoC family dehydratase N-terminal domain-containing protein [Sphingosinicella sp. GR2756]MDT9598779.1 MaoC family dehydratase N-terminal domain-containing protein [Sphingosinicella sp. GR2756]
MSDAIEAVDRLEPRLRDLFAASLEELLFEDKEDASPLGVHWCLFPPTARTSELGADGHPPRRHAVSMDEFPRRMWVGGRLEFHRPLPLGVALTRTTVLRPVERKEGRSGALVLSGFDHEYRADRQLLLSERQDIVFLPKAVTPSPRPDERKDAPAPEGQICRPLRLSEALLFRYSALTFNSHRIHYDADYARTEEGYAGVLAQGPLQATILLNLAASLLGRAPTRFDYRARAPLHLGGTAYAFAWAEREVVHCRIQDRSGRPTMEASAC